MTLEAAVYTIRHTSGAYLLVNADGVTADRVTYDRHAGFEAKREAWQEALARCEAAAALNTTKVAA